jgi:two-component system chemotaxis response regulator CheY
VQPKFGDRLVLKDCLYSIGCQVVGEAKDTDETLEKYDSLRPDFVVVDAVVPEVDGVACTSRLLRFDPDAKVLVCVSRGQQSLAIQSLSAGAKEFITKPINERQLKKAVMNMSRQPMNLTFEGNL